MNTGFSRFKIEAPARYLFCFSLFNYLGTWYLCSKVLEVSGRVLPQVKLLQKVPTPSVIAQLRGLALVHYIGVVRDIEGNQKYIGAQQAPDVCMLLPKPGSWKVSTRYSVTGIRSILHPGSPGSPEGRLKKPFLFVSSKVGLRCRCAESVKRGSIRQILPR